MYDYMIGLRVTRRVTSWERDLFICFVFSVFVRGDPETVKEDGRRRVAQLC